MSKQVRILTETRIDGATYQPNEVVEFSNKTAKSLCDAGASDMNIDAVNYCVNEMAAKVVVHSAAPGDAQADDVPEVK